MDHKDAFEKLQSKVFMSADGCWLYQGSLTKDGYGQMRAGEKVLSTHRLAYLAANGPIPRGKVIRHQCDVRQCCNPAHLIVGDHEDNTQDIVDRDRHAGNRRVLSPDELARVVAMRTAGATKREIAQALECNWYTVSAALDASRVDVAPRSGRPKGSRNHVTRITAESKEQMKALYATGKFTQKALAEKFGCDQTYVSLLVRR